MKKQMLWWVGVAVLTLGLVGQYVIYRSQPIASTHATWYPYDSFAEVTDAGQVIVEAEVVSVAKGPDEIVSLAGSVEPSGQDVIPHQDARLRVVNSVEGSVPAGAEITVRHVYGEITLPQGPAAGAPGQTAPQVEQPAAGEENKSTADPNTARPRVPAGKADPNAPPTANVKIFMLEDDPAYTVGERYFLVLAAAPGNSADAPAPAGVYQTVHPAGRYRINADNTLAAVGTDQISMSVDSRALSEVESAATGKTEIPVSESSDLRRRVTTGASGTQPGMPRTGTHTHGSTDTLDPNIFIYAVAAIALMGLGAGLVSRRRQAKG